MEQRGGPESKAGNATEATEPEPLILPQPELTQAMRPLKLWTQVGPALTLQPKDSCLRFQHRGYEETFIDVSVG